MDSTANAAVMPSAVTDAPAVTPRPRTWLRRIAGGGQIIETCPEWCTLDHDTTQAACLTDLSHVSEPVSAQVEIFDRWADGEPVKVAVPILVAQIHLDPYSENPKRNVPFATFQPGEDEVADNLSPEELATIIATIRTQCNRLDQVHARLVAVRAEHAAAVAL